MNTIQFKSVIPQIFANRENQDSEIWQQDVTFEKGKLYLIEAESGRGKSTLCSYIIGYRHDYSGKILFDNTNIRTFNTHQWSKQRTHHISTLFQELRLFPELTAMENVEIKNRITGYKSQFEINDWFDILGIADKKDTPVGCMSFGQQQRVAMMRSLVQPFDFLLADEPISHLDDKNSNIMGQLMMKEVKEQGAGTIIMSIGKHILLPYDSIIQL